MKVTSKVMTMAVLVALISMNVRAASLQPLPEGDMARYGATHVIEVVPADMTGVIASNTAWAVTNLVTAPCSLKFAGMVLLQTFQDTKSYDTNNVMKTTNSIALSCGTTDSTTKWINGVQVAQDQTPTVYGSFGTDYSVTCYATNGAAGTVTSPIMDSQTTNFNLVVTMGAPGAGASLSKLRRGRALLLFRIIGKGSGSY